MQGLGALRKDNSLKYRVFKPILASAATTGHVVEAVITAAFEIPLHELRASTRREARIATARQVAMYLAHVACGLTLTRVGAFFGRDRTTVAHACSVVEDRRDDAAFDRCVEEMEGAVRHLVRARSGLSRAK